MKWYAMVPWLALGVASGACAPTASDVKLPSGDLDRGTTLVRLSYQRPAAFGPTGRPAGFEIIANYHTDDEIVEYDGTWSDATQTLSASVSLPIGSQNLVYVIDEAVPPGLPMAISAGRQGRLHPIPCSTAVTTMQVCYELEVVSGLITRTASLRADRSAMRAWPE